MDFLHKLFGSKVTITPTIVEFKEPTTTIQGEPINNINNNDKGIRVFKYASDIHLEMRNDLEGMEKLRNLYQFEKRENHRYFLALVGDIGSPFFKVENLIKFLQECSKQYERVFYVMGNHEYYNRQNTDYQMYEIHLELRKVCNQFNNVHLLENEIFMIDDDYKIIGTTLWSHVDNENIVHVESRLNDYRLIKESVPSLCGELDDPITGRSPTRNINVLDTNKLHKKAIDFIKYQVSLEMKTQVKCIILSHHAPQFNDHKNQTFTSHPKYVEMHNTAQAFCTDLSKFIAPPMVAFIYGHTHYSTDYSYNNVRILSNQYGYERGDDLTECLFNPNCYFIL